MKLGIPGLRHIADAYQSRTEPESLTVIAQTFWRLLIALIFIVDMCVIGWGVIVLSAALDTTPTTQSPQHVSAPALDRTALSSMLDAFEARSGRFNSLKGAKLPLTDPTQ